MVNNTSTVFLKLFGQRIRELRAAKGLSQERLAALCHLDRTYISSLERGKRNVSLKNVAVLADSLDVSLSQSRSEN
jgi:transcriptional regulator with XRE-family HTH domain